MRKLESHEKSETKKIMWIPDSVFQSWIELNNLDRWFVEFVINLFSFMTPRWSSANIIRFGFSVKSSVCSIVNQTRHRCNESITYSYWHFGFAISFILSFVVGFFRNSHTNVKFVQLTRCFQKWSEIRLLTPPNSSISFLFLFALRWQID